MIAWLLSRDTFVFRREHNAMIAFVEFSRIMFLDESGQISMGSRRILEERPGPRGIGRVGCGR
jgi:hypothetical protein